MNKEVLEKIETIKDIQKPLFDIKADFLNELHKDFPELTGERLFAIAGLCFDWGYYNAIAQAKDAAERAELPERELWVYEEFNDEEIIYTAYGWEEHFNGMTEMLEKFNPICDKKISKYKVRTTEQDPEQAFFEAVELDIEPFEVVEP